MSVTPLASVTNSVVQLIESIVLDPLVVYLKTVKHVDVTVDELTSALHLPVQPKTPSSLLPAPNFGPMKTTRAKKEPAPVNGPTCNWVFQRGAIKGTKCPKPATENGYCTACSKKSTAKIDPDATSAVVSSVSTDPTKVVRDINTIPILNGPAGLCREVETDFVLQQLSNEKVQVLGVYQVDGSYRPLTEDEKVKAKAKGFQVASEVTPTVPSVATVPSVPKIPMIPSIPRV